MAVGEKSLDWRDRILVESETRYITQVLDPALAQVRAARFQVEAQLHRAGGDAAKTAMYKAEIEQMNAFEQKVQAHMHSTLARFGKRAK
jgi:hypothetical protein